MKKGTELNDLHRAIPTGTCRYCGVQQILEEPCYTQETADDVATKQCMCAEARALRQQQEYKEKRARMKSKLEDSISDFEIYLDNRHVALTPEFKMLLLNNGQAVIDEIVSKAQVVNGKIKVAISYNSKGDIVINATYSDSLRAEVKQQ